MKRDSVVFYRSWLEAIKNLPREMQGEVLTAIIEYGLDGETTESLKPITRAMLAVVKTQIDVNNIKYKNGQIGGYKGAEYGYKGGRPKKTPEGESPNNPQITPKKPPRNPQETPYNVYDNENENDYKESSLLREQKKDELSLPPPFPGKVDYDGVMERYNSMAGGKLPLIKSMTGARKAAVAARIAQHGEESVSEVLSLALQSPFLLGGNDRNWRCDFDWIFKQANYTKILEGNYVQKDRYGPRRDSRGVEEDEEYKRELARRFEASERKFREKG